MRRQGTIRTKGFSIIELMISVGLFMVLSAAIMSSMMKTQQTRRTNEIRSNLQDRVRAASEMIIHDVGQAGKTVAPDTLLFTSASFASASSSTTYTNGSGSTACGSSAGSTFQVATITTNNSAANLYLGESVLIDSGAATQEQGWICGSINLGSTSTLSVMRSASAANYAHAGATPFYPVGIFAEGILSQNRTGIASTSSQLLLMGDIDESGTPVLVRYKCSATSGNTGGTLTRTVWSFTAAANTTGNTATLLDNVICYFDYSDDAGSPYINYLPAGPSDHLNNYYIVQAVNLYITANSDSNDPVTGQPFTVTKSYENIQPRNMINAIAQDKVYRQWTPQTGIFASTTLP